MIAGKAFNSI